MTSKSGSQQYIANMLSRAFLPSSDSEAPYEWINMTKHLPIRPECLEKLRKKNANDDVIKLLAETILSGWPTIRQEIPITLTPYYSYADELCVHDVVPSSMRKEMKETAHQDSHLGVEGCLSRLQEFLFLPGMSAKVCHYIATCDICRTFDSSQRKETFLCIESADRPWEKVAVDLFTFDNKDHMVLVDYYSNFLEVDVLEAGSTSKHIIKKLKPHFARHGIPNILVSDN